MEPGTKSIKEERIRKITQLYYSRPEIQKAIFNFAENREVVPRYFEGFGKRPDTLQYPGDIFELVKKGATSFHCSQEIWKDPLKLSIGMAKKEGDSLRMGWDFLIDIDCKWFDYSKLAAQAILQVFKNHGIKEKNVGVKFSGNKGFHIILPWKAFPKKIAGEETKNLFPEIPRRVISYVGFQAEKIMKDSLPHDFYSQFRNTKIKQGIKCNKCREVAQEYDLVNYFCSNCNREEYKNIVEGQKRDYVCPDCRRNFVIKGSKKMYRCNNCEITSEQNSRNFSRSMEVDLFELMGLDLILVSSRHLFRMPYSLHEKTSLASVVLDPAKICDFELMDADPMKVKFRNFIPESKSEEAKELLMQALDWYKENNKEETVRSETDYVPIKIQHLSEKNFPPSIIKIMAGLQDGRKRGLFVLLNFFRSIGMERKEVEDQLDKWNKKNEIPLKNGYINSQIIWSYRNKIVPPPNFNKDYYKGIGVIPNPEEMRYKNPANYFIKKSLSEQNQPKKKIKKKNK